MALPKLLIIAWSLAAGLAGEAGSPGEAGSIGGLVRNGTRGGAPAAGAEVVLRVEVDGQLMTAAETTADAEGRFLFQPLPLRDDLAYLPGANRAGVHYPGQRVRLSPRRAHAAVELVVYDAVQGESPLVARLHEVVIRPEPGALRVNETLCIDNPTLACYVGQPAAEGAEPATLRLAVPPDFDRATFDEEFLGRRFALVGGKLVTGIPWPPGQRKVRFTYVLPNHAARRVWQRPLDLPCSSVRLRVLTEKPDEVVCNLAQAASQNPGEMLFTSSGATLPAGYTMRLEIGSLPVPWMAYGRWLALAALVGLVAAAGILTKSPRPIAGRIGARPSCPHDAGRMPAPVRL